MARSRKAPKSNEDAIDSGEDVEDDEDSEDEDEQLSNDTLARTSRKKAASSSSTGRKTAASHKPASKQPVRAAVDTSSDEDESASSSEDDVDSGSDFEEALPKLRSKANPIESATIKARKPKISKALKAAKGGKARGTSAARRKSTTVANEDDEEDDSAIYGTVHLRPPPLMIASSSFEFSFVNTIHSCRVDAVLDSQAALDVVAADWINLYKSSRTDALRKLTNFLIRSCGCKQSVSAEDFVNIDDMVETLKSILLRYKEVHNITWVVILLEDRALTMLLVLLITLEHRQL